MNIQYDRKYLGVTITSQNYRQLLDNKEDIRFHEKHLKAYLNGIDMFFHGFNYAEDGKKLSKKAHFVEQEIIASFIEKDKKITKTFKNQGQLNTFLLKRKLENSSK